MPNAIDAVAVTTNAVTPSGSDQPVVVQPNNTNVVPMRRGGEVASGYSTGPVAGMGVDPAAFSRTSTTTPVNPPPQVIVVQAPEKKPGFFKRLGRALNPFTLPKRIAAKSKGLARAIGWGSTAAAGAGAVATTALAANHFAPVAVHGVLKGIGMLGLLGPQGAALGGAVVAGALTIGAIGAAFSFLRAGKKKKVVEPKNPETPQAPEQPKPAEEKKPSFFRRAVAGVMNTVGIGGGLAVGGYGLFQAGAAVMGGATVAAAAPMLLVPAAAIFAGGLLVAAAKAIKGKSE